MNQLIFSLALNFLENDEIIGKSYILNKEFKQIAQNHLRHRLFVQYFEDCMVLLQNLDVSDKLNRVLIKDCKRYWKRITNERSDRDLMWFVQKVHILSFGEFDHPIFTMLNRLYDSNLLKTHDIFFELFPLISSKNNTDFYSKVVVDCSKFFPIFYQSFGNFFEKFGYIDCEFFQSLFLMSDREIEERLDCYNKICLFYGIQNPKDESCVVSIWSFVIAYGAESVKMWNALIQKFPSLDNKSIESFFHIKFIVESFRKQGLKFNHNNFHHLEPVFDQVFPIINNQKFEKIQCLSSRTKKEIVFSSFDRITLVHFHCLVLSDEQIDTYFNHVMPLFNFIDEFHFPQQTQILTKFCQRLDNFELIKRCQIVKQLNLIKFNDVMKALVMFPYEIKRIPFSYDMFPSEIEKIQQLMKTILPHVNEMYMDGDHFAVCSLFLPFWPILKDRKYISLMGALELIANKNKKCSEIQSIYEFLGAVHNPTLDKIQSMIYIQTETSFDNNDFVSRLPAFFPAFEKHLKTLAQKFDLNHHINNEIYVKEELMKLIDEFLDRSVVFTLSLNDIDHLKYLKNVLIELNDIQSNEIYPMNYDVDKIIRLDYATLVDYWNLMKQMMSKGINMLKINQLLLWRKSLIRYLVSISDEERDQIFTRLRDTEARDSSFLYQLIYKIMKSNPDLLINDIYF